MKQSLSLPSTCSSKKSSLSSVFDLADDTTQRLDENSNSTSPLNDFNDDSEGGEEVMVTNGATNDDPEGV